MAGDITQYQISEDAFFLSNTMDNVLKNLVATFESYNIPIPARQFWTTGEAVFDCEQVCLTLVGTYLGTPGNEALQALPCTNVKSMTVTVNIVRQQAPIPVSNKLGIPTAGKIQNDAMWVAVDTWVIMDNLQNLQSDPANTMAIATSTIPAADGGFMCTSVTYTTALI